MQEISYYDVRANVNDGAELKWRSRCWGNLKINFRNLHIEM